MTLSSLCRAVTPLNLPSPASVRGVASLSGIHRGLRRSERVHPQGPKTPDASKPTTYRERQEARKKLANPGFKIRKGKKDITKYAEELRPKSRRSRFYDPDSSFGKKSLVYQVKSGQLRDELRKMGENEKQGDLFSQKIKPHGEAEPERRSSRSRSARRGLPGRREEPRQRSSLASDSRGQHLDVRDDRQGSGRADLWDSHGSRSTGRTRARSRPPSAERRETREPPKPDSKPAEPSAEETEKPLRRDHLPVSIPYTTAVSQFLYGKSVVEATLLGSRRKLYKLYIYRGRDAEAEKRRDKQDTSIERLASAKGVQTVILREDGLRLMDKMSGGRPHNNYILEASPLPQLPVTGLGPLSSNPSKPGFSVNLAHQSAEEAAIAGTSDFLSPRTDQEPTHKPLVVLLHGVLDPGNLGAILRSAGFLGATAVATTKRGSASLTPVALKAAAGASETVPLLSVDSVERFLDESRASGWAVFAAVPPPANGRYSRSHVDLRGVEETDPLREKPCILLLGSEGEGLSKSVRKRADFDVHIPNLLGSDMVDSLNVSVAAGLLCNAFLRGKIGLKAAREEALEKFRLF